MTEIDYIVVEVGSRCPLRVGEHVALGNSCTIDFLAGGVVVEQQVVREDGSRIMLKRGPETGARLVSERRSATGDRRER